MDDIILTNAWLVLAEAVVHGTLVLRGDRIAAIDTAISADRRAIDCAGDTLIPGIVDLHTDNLERQAQPRPNTRWPSRSAFLSHDAQCAVSGVTTVLDALCLGDLSAIYDRNATLREGIGDLDALTAAGVLKAEHFLHLRCELATEIMPQLLDTHAEHKLLRLVSLMDHSPGVGQFADLNRFRTMRRREGFSDADIEARLAALTAQRQRLRDPNRRYAVERMRARHIPLASHDDLHAADIAEGSADGIRISEFPVTMAAARAAKAAGMQVIAGAPNIVRGGSHSGNVAAADLVRAGLVDALASDYVPASLVEAAFLIAARLDIALPAAVAMVSANPAAMVGLADRGRLAIGLRADLARVRLYEDMPVVRAVWRAGERVA